jgi:hypothetical protein
MAKRLGVVGVVGAAALALSGSVSAGQHSAPSPLRGGTLRVGVDTPFGAEGRPGSVEHALDPQFEYVPTYWELYRCCLLRTLLSYSGQSTGQGGATLRPDLTASCTGSGATCSCSGRAATSSTDAPAGDRVVTAL